MADAVNIQINALVDGAVTNINKVNTALGKTETAAKKTGGGFKEFAGKLNGAVTATTGLNLGQLGAAAAIGMVVNAVKKAVDGFIDYSNAIQDGSRLTGIAVEDYSRLVQVADDVRISQEQLKTAFVIASRQGIDVSLDGIQRLSEQYNALTDPTEKAQLLLKTFGRSGAEMGRLMEMGADGIRSAAAAVADGLVMDREAIAKAEKLRLAKDALADSVTALGNKFSEFLIPALAWVVEGLVDVVGAGEKFIQWIKNNINATENANKAAVKIAGTYEDYRGELDKNAKSLGYLIDENGNLVQSFTYQGQTTYKLIEANYALTESGWDVAKSQEGMNTLADDGIAYFGDLGGAIKKLAEQDMQAAIQAADDLSDKLSSQMDLTLKLTDLTGNYKDKMDELKKKYGEVETKLANLNLNFPDDAEGIASAKQDLVDIQDEMDKTADAYGQATKRIVWDMMIAKLSIDGYTQAEFNWAMQAGVDMGIITQESADLAVALMADADKEIKAFEDTQTALAGIKDWIDRLESKDIYVKTYYESIGTPPVAGSWQDFSDWQTPVNRGGGGAMAKGAWYTVGDMGPEPMRAGQGAYASTTYNYAMTINAGNVAPSDVVFGFETMALLTGG